MSKRKARSVPPLFIPKISAKEAIAIATEFARSQGITTDGCRHYTWGFGGYLVDLKKPASEIRIAEPEDRCLEETGFVVSPSPRPESAILVKVDDKTGAAKRFYPL